MLEREISVKVPTRATLHGFHAADQQERMELKPELINQISRLSDKSEQLQREKDELKVEAHQELERHNFQIARLEKEIEGLKKAKEPFERFLGIGPVLQGRASRGALKDACMAVLNGAPDGLLGKEVEDEAGKRFPDLNPRSISSALSRYMKEGELVRDDKTRKYTVARHR